MSERIPQEELDREHRNLQRRIAAEIVRAMAEADMMFEDIDVKIGADIGSVRKEVIAMIDGKSEVMRPASDLAYALGYRFNVVLRSWEPENRNDGESA